MDVCLRTSLVCSHSKPSSVMRKQQFISMDICSEGVNQLRSSDSVVTEVYSFLQQIVN